ncbi:MAG: hypothetical protein HY335_04005, partial [Deinococcus sp.]|nr:hypothetical protein [Deinococcus sp.]
MESCPLWAKVTPPALPPHFVRRQRLLDLLHQARSQLLAVVAPAGYGKTCLARDFLDTVSHHRAWLTLDESDCDPAVLARSLLGAVLGPGAQAGDVSPHELVDQLLAQLPQGLTLVLDSFERLAGADRALGLLRRLLAHLPASCQVLVAGRSLDSLEAAALRTGQLSGIGASDLRCTAGEVLSLAAATGESLDPAGAQAL